MVRSTRKCHVSKRGSTWRHATWCNVKPVTFIQNRSQFSLSSKLHFSRFETLPLYFSLLFLLESFNLEVYLPICLFQRVKQVTYFPFLLLLLLFFFLFTFEPLKCAMVFFVFFIFYFLFFLLSHVSIFLDFVWFIYTLSKHVSAQNTFMYKNMYTHKWVYICTYGYTYMPYENKLGIFLYIYFLETHRHINVNSQFNMYIHVGMHRHI